MWAALGDSAPPESIADLAAGRVLHDFAQAKHLEVHALLQHGHHWQDVLAAQAAAEEAGAKK